MKSGALYSHPTLEPVEFIFPVTTYLKQHIRHYITYTVIKHKVRYNIFVYPCEYLEYLISAVDKLANTVCKYQSTCCVLNPLHNCNISSNGEFVGWCSIENICDWFMPNVVYYLLILAVNTLTSVYQV